MRIADDIDVGRRHRLPFAHDLGRERMLRLAGGDVRNRPKLDDARRRERSVVSPYAYERTPGRVGADGAVGHAGDGPSPRGDAGNPTCRLAQPLLGDARDQSAARTRSTSSSPRSWPTQSASTPASSARTADSSTPTVALTAFISSASASTSPSKPSSPRRRPCTIARAERRRRIVEGRHAHVRGHDRLHARSDRCAERLEPVLDVARDGRQLEMRVLLGRAVARKVLRARSDVTRLRAADVGRDVACDERRRPSRTRASRSPGSPARSRRRPARGSS